MLRSASTLLILAPLAAFAAEPDQLQQEDERLTKARALFEAYVALERAFDPAIADLYADDAYIENTRTYPSGEERTLVFPPAQYKALIRQAMPLAKTRGDTSTYSDAVFSVEGERVRIDALRYSNLKQYEAPIQLEVGRGPDGEWLVFKEISRSIP